MPARPLKRTVVPTTGIGTETETDLPIYPETGTMTVTATSRSETSEIGIERGQGLTA